MLPAFFRLGLSKPHATSNLFPESCVLRPSGEKGPRATTPAWPSLC